MLTLVDGEVVYAAGSFTPLSPPSVPVLSEWSPVVTVPGYYRSAPPQVHQCNGPCGVYSYAYDIARQSSVPVSDNNAFWGALGCSCFAF